ncbi:hypothetical protein ON010_g7244 [Phytophthora cinnamomi]|nr:hypothetical protein ON010_g7244 [Phytophthora cinnamomi]
MCINRKRPRGEQLRSPPPTPQQLQADNDQLKRVKTESPTSVDRFGIADNQMEEKEEIATTAHRDEMVAAILTITSALGLSRETLHLCVGLLDRYMEQQSIEVAKLEALSISDSAAAKTFQQLDVERDSRVRAEDLAYSEFSDHGPHDTRRAAKKNLLFSRTQPRTRNGCPSIRTVPTCSVFCRPTAAEGKIQPVFQEAACGCCLVRGVWKPNFGRKTAAIGTCCAALSNAP